MVECFPDTIAQELEEPFGDLDELIDRIDVETSFGNRKLENRIDGIQKSRLLIDRVNEALTVLRKKPVDGEKLYDVIYQTYIGPEKLTHTELLYRLDLCAIITDFVSRQLQSCLFACGRLRLPKLIFGLRC